MQTLQVFFDYACPYCLQAHRYLEELLPEFPQLTIQWQPCEAHPRPDRYGPHSDLLVQGFYVAQRSGANLQAYHTLAYSAALQNRINIEDLHTVAAFMQPLLSTEAFVQAVQSGCYTPKLAAANQLAWGTMGLQAVPSYRLGGYALNAVEDVGVTLEMLRAFLAAHAIQ